MVIRQRNQGAPTLPQLSAGSRPQPKAGRSRTGEALQSLRSSEVPGWRQALTLRARELLPPVEPLQVAKTLGGSSPARAGPGTQSDRGDAESAEFAEKNRLDRFSAFLRVLRVSAVRFGLTQNPAGHASGRQIEDQSPLDPCSCRRTVGAG